AIEWVQTLPRRWARNAAFFAAGVSLAMSGPYLTEANTSRDPGAIWPMLGFSAALVLIMTTGLGVVAFLMGAGARRRLRRLQQLSDESAYKAVASLPGRYFLWGFVLGCLGPLSDLALQWRDVRFEPWETNAQIIENLSHFIGDMLGAGIFT